MYARRERSPIELQEPLEDADHHCADLAGVHFIALQNQRRMPVASFGTAWFGEIDPPDLSAVDHDRDRPARPTTTLLRRRNATAAGSSPGCPPLAMARFQASVASAGRRKRARNSRAAVARSALRESFNCRARASISRNRSSGEQDGRFHRGRSISGLHGLRKVRQGPSRK